MTHIDINRRLRSPDPRRKSRHLTPAFAQGSKKRVGRLPARAMIAVLGISLFGAACGAGDSGEVGAGGVIVRDISVDTVDGTDITATEPTDSTTTSSDDGDDSGDGDDGGSDDTTSDDEEATVTTLPQADDASPQEELFAAVEVFQSCMTAEGIDFIGTPDASLGADAPQNQQPYIDALIRCATRSDIQNKIAASQAAQANLTPEEIETQNRSFLLFRDCMIGRGWFIPDPVPDDNGLLFSLAQTSEWEAPAGEQLIDSNDVAACQDEVAAGEDS